MGNLLSLDRETGKTQAYGAGVALGRGVAIDVGRAMGHSPGIAPEGAPPAIERQVLSISTRPRGG